MATEKEVNITAVCRQLGYSKQAYYKSLHNRTLNYFYEEIVKDKVLAIRRQMPRLGVRKLYHILKDELIGEKPAIGRDKLFSLLRQDGHCFVHLVTDAYSKKIMGYKVSTDLSSANTLAALQDAIKGRQYKHKLIHHSDRGLQYCSSAYIKKLTSNGISISMTENGNPYDNAIAERINGILKDEFGLDDRFENIEQAEIQTNQAIKMYNQRRPHMSCSMLTPNEMHSQTKIKPKRWHKKSLGTLVRS